MKSFIHDFVRIIGVLAALSIVFAAEAAAEMTGKARAVDGDTIEIAGRHIDLLGIDAPEEGQTCQAQGREWACGLEATFALAFALGDHWVTCTDETRGDAGSAAAICFTGPYELNAKMVRMGWALAEPGQAYAGNEQAARAARRGIWRGRFVHPRAWRGGAR